MYILYEVFHSNTTVYYMTYINDPVIKCFCILGPIITRVYMFVFTKQHLYKHTHTRTNTYTQYS